MERMLERNLVLKILSACLAVLLWLQATAISGPALPQTVRDIPVQYRNLASGLVLLSGPASVNVTVRGRSDLVRHLSRDGFTAFVDLRGAGLGRSTFTVSVEGPEGIIIGPIAPDNLPVDIDAWDNRQVPVAIYTLGSPGTDHAMKDHQTRPTDLYVEGPRSAVQLVSHVVAKVDISGATQTIARTVVVRPVNAEGAEVQGVTVTPSTVDVQVSIVRLPPARQVSVRANLQGRPAAGYVQGEAVVVPAEARMWAQSTVGDVLRYLWTHPIDIEGATGTVERDVLLLVPEGVDKVEPVLVHVTVPVTEVTEERELGEVPIKMTDLGPNLRARLEPQFVALTVSGPRSALAALDVSEIEVRASLAGLAAGTHQVRLTIVLPQELTLKSSAPVEVKAVLETL
ncbi:MAG: CdaR family protein [Bacillota bacterium]|nr:CdaR family protein [Bacillota bacterium]